MAIVKTIPNPLGPGTIDAYAKYGYFGIDARNLVVNLDLDIYQSQEARDAVDEKGNQLYPPVRVERYVLNTSGASGPDGPLPGAPDFATYASGDNANPQGTGATIYGFLKAFTSWTGSTDA